MSRKTQLPQPAQMNEGKGDKGGRREEGRRGGKKNKEEGQERADGRRRRVICRHMPTTIFDTLACEQLKPKAARILKKKSIKKI